MDFDRRSMTNKFHRDTCSGDRSCIRRGWLAFVDRIDLEKKKGLQKIEMTFNLSTYEFPGTTWVDNFSTKSDWWWRSKATPHPTVHKRIVDPSHGLQTYPTVEAKRSRSRRLPMTARGHLCRCDIDRWPKPLGRALIRVAIVRHAYCRLSHRLIAFFQPPCRQQAHTLRVPDVVVRYPCCHYRRCLQLNSLWTK